MSMSDTWHIQIFLSSPGDVNEERQITQEIIAELERDPLLRNDGVRVEVVAWDDPYNPAPILATTDPQTSVNLFKHKPSECQIVIVILWSRLGTPLPDRHRKTDGSLFNSGTEWEYEDAINAERRTSRPFVLVYQRTEKPKIEMDDPDVFKKIEQYNAVKAFLGGLTNQKLGYNQYSDPADFRKKLTSHLKQIIPHALRPPEPRETTSPTKTSSGKPYPGLFAFTEANADNFFGRERETDELIERVKAFPFVGVVGASGSGKSSLVGAGLIPKLRMDAIPGSKDWLIVRFTPGSRIEDKNPFMALADALADELKMPPLMIGATLAMNPDKLVELCAMSAKPGTLLFIDQFEELFTLAGESWRTPFIEMLTKSNPPVRIVVTMRSDFYHRCVDHPALTDLLEHSTYPLSVPKPSALYQMITRPAERAGLQFDSGLADQILSDTGSNPGALALMAYLLDELYEAGKGSGKLTFEDYDALGGVQGAIGKRAESTFANLDDTAQAQLKNVFRELVEVDENAVATRRRSPYSKVAENDDARKLVDAFIEARLLVSDDVGAHSHAPNATLEVAHEALLRSWLTLADWIKDAAGDLYALRQARQAANEWDKKDRPEYLLWQHERLQPVYDALKNLEIEAETPLKEFIRPEAERLLDEFKAKGRESDQLRIVGDWLRIGISSAPQMMAAFAYTNSEDVSDSLIKALAWWNSLETLLAGVEASSAKVQLGVLQVIGLLNRRGLTSEVLPLLRDADKNVRRAALQVLTAQGDATLIPDLLPLLRDAAWSVRQAAVGFLTAQGDATLIPDLLPLLRDAASSVRQAAVGFLEKHGDKGVIPHLLSSLADPDSKVRKAAFDALMKLSGRALPPS